MSRFRQHVQDRLHALRSAGLLRDPVVGETPSGTHLVVGERRLLNLCSNNYLGLADDHRLRDRLVLASRRWGSATASRLITGSLRPHRDAERALAEFVGHADARLFTSGYAANVGAVSSLVGPDDLVLSDALNHASLIDGCRLSRARTVVFPHRDLEALDSLLRAHRSSARAALVVTDAVFSMDGDLAPLAGLREVADRHGAGLLVDEAHSLGVLGPSGTGLARALGVHVDVSTGMLGKAFGLSGGFVAADADTLRVLESTARAYVFSTAMHSALADVIPDLVELVRTADPARARLRAHRDVLAAALPRARATPEPHASIPILPVLVGDATRAVRVSAALAERGVFVQAIRPPTVPAGTSRLRIVPIASHEDGDIAEAARIFRDVLGAAGLPIEEQAP